MEHLEKDLEKQELTVIIEEYKRIHGKSPSGSTLWIRILIIK
jgi:hypothetical protein